MTRFVVLSASLAFAATAVAQQPNRPRQPAPVRYKLGPDSMVKEGVPQGKLIGPTEFKSKIIPGTVRQYWVYVPVQYTPEKPAALLVFQDGQRATNPKGSLRVPNVLNNLIASREIPVTIGIFITPGARGDVYSQNPRSGNPDNRDKEYDVLNDTYAKFLLDEMLPEVGKSYNLSKNPDDRCIGGTSSGAICAFTVAWQRPNEFHKVISFIGSFTNIHGGHVYPDLVRKADPKPIRIYMQDGINDLRSPNNLNRDWYLQNQKMRAAFQEKGYDYKYILGQGGHSDDHGGANLPDAMRWIWRDHPGVKK
ncbi:MAG TPA: alpha/beta hydrolase-fold protein [Fimbriiglobus sp.]|jgi:enterochelin esterase family protein